MTVNKEKNHFNMEFALKVGNTMREFLKACILDAYKSEEDRSGALFNALINFVANTMLELTGGDNIKENFRHNMNSIIKGLNDWIDAEDLIYVNYDPDKEKITKINKEDLH